MRIGVHAILSNVGSTRGRNRLVPRIVFGADVDAGAAMFGDGFAVSFSAFGSAVACIASPRKATWRCARSSS
jgi:hypothetical protein